MSASIAFKCYTPFLKQATGVSVFGVKVWPVCACLFIFVIHIRKKISFSFHPLSSVLKATSLSKTRANHFTLYAAVCSGILWCCNAACIDSRMKVSEFDAMKRDSRFNKNLKFTAYLVSILFSDNFIPDCANLLRCVSLSPPLSRDMRSDRESIASTSHPLFNTCLL